MLIVAGGVLGASPASACSLFGLIDGHIRAGMVADYMSEFAKTQRTSLGSLFTTDDPMLGEFPADVVEVDGRSFGFGFFLNRDSGFETQLPLTFREATFAGWWDGTGLSAVFSEMPRFSALKRLLDTLGPRAIVGHLRVPSAGAGRIPNPHPFHKVLNGKDYLFAHNGTIDESPLLTKLNIIAGRTMDLAVSTGSTMAVYGPYERGFFNAIGAAYRTMDSSRSFIDSELYFIYLLSRIRDSSTCAEAAIFGAVVELIAVTGTDSVNFVMTDGDTMYALRYPDENILSYQEKGGQIRAVMKTDETGWTLLPAGAAYGTLAIMKPCQRTRLYRVEVGATHGPSCLPDLSGPIVSYSDCIFDHVKVSSDTSAATKGAKRVVTGGK